MTGFGYPVVPQGQARIRCQISAAHTRDDLDMVLAAMRKVGSRLRSHLTARRQVARSSFLQAITQKCLRV